MLTRLVLAVAICALVLSLFIPWVSVSLSVNGPSVNGNTNASLSIYDSDLKAVPYLQWVRAGAILTLVFALFALMSTFYHIRYPRATMGLSAFAMILGITTFAVWIPKSGGDSSVTFYVRLNPTDVQPTQVYQSQQPFTGGFISFVVGTCMLLLAAISSNPSGYSSRMYNRVAV